MFVYMGGGEATAIDGLGGGEREQGRERNGPIEKQWREKGELLRSYP